jgi:hypothetical protein
MKLYRLTDRIVNKSLLLSISLFTFNPAIAIAGAEDIFFQVPSGNIHCWSYDDKSLTCEIGQNNAKIPPQPQDCNLDWGNRFLMANTGKSERVCHGDTIGRDPKHRVLKYGKSWRDRGFVCISTKTGLTCRNQDGHGWKLSKNQQTLF